MTGGRKVLSLCFRGGREGGSRVPSQNHCDTKTDPEVSCALPATKTGTLFYKPEREISLCHKTLLSRLCQVLPCGMGSEPGGSSGLQMNPVILWEPGARRNPGPAQGAAAPRSVLWSRERNCSMGWNQEIVTS